jgi:hypothetical protein
MIGKSRPPDDDDGPVPMMSTLDLDARSVTKGQRKAAFRSLATFAIIVRIFAG